MLTTIKNLPALTITSDNFQAYGQLITSSKDGKLYDQTDAKLNLKNGIPRFYIMQLKKRGRQFDRITRHCQCTQCLGALEGKEWLMAVAPPSEQNYPDLTQLKAFKIPGNCFIKLNVGTWHAGPYFDHDEVDFYNLELSDTNVVDHFTYNFLKEDNLTFEIVT
ncbi:ureidoglycolate lyase [Crocosphaera sp. XPORK-15E]|uniref:ureidoglycolate lyase n=1 Tax=Crocosphaera sp. XPORK-15E TaxID=3110247 RepID=UPI002B1EA414|nr:ureidoglycolate lyase [Crocosphaera sp. XPORK-15E]MEA5533648.1 ureidoglycolate lyase [Crocosphaera sp. XPORK-15E]